MIIETEILQKGEMAVHSRVEDGAGKDQPDELYDARSEK